MENSVKLDYEIGEIVEVVTSKSYKALDRTRRVYRRTAVVLGFEDYKLFDSVKCVKIMVVGASEPTFTLSDRIRKL